MGFKAELEVNLPSINALIDERFDQIVKHGYTVAADDESCRPGALTSLAYWFLMDDAVLIGHRSNPPRHDGGTGYYSPDPEEFYLNPDKSFLFSADGWSSWSDVNTIDYWKEKKRSKTKQERLIIAAALLCAEYDLADYRAKKNVKPGEAVLDADPTQPTPVKE